MYRRPGVGTTKVIVDVSASPPVLGAAELPLRSQLPTDVVGAVDRLPTSHNLDPVLGH